MLKKLSLLALLLCLSPFVARADTVQLTSGSASYFIQDVNIRATGANFSIGVIGDMSDGMRAGFNSITDAIGMVSFQNMVTRSFAGGFSFSDTFLSGTVRGYESNDFFHERPPIFTVEFFAFGHVMRDEFNHRIFIIGAATPVPEPATMILLATGLVGISTRQWRKRVRP